MMRGENVKPDANHWYPSTTGPLLPLATESLLENGREVLHRVAARTELEVLFGTFVFAGQRDGVGVMSVAECTRLGINE